MSFRPFNLEICRASLAGAIFLLCVAVSRAGDSQSQSTDFSLPSSSLLDENTNQTQSQDSPLSRFFLPHAPNTFQVPGRPGALPPPHPQVAIPTEKERELLDRRRNWVFMTPEEMMGTDDSETNSPDGKADKDQKPSTVMERYYQRLFDSDQQQATNQPASNKFDAKSWTTSGNPFGLGGSREDNSQSTSSSDNQGVFQSIRADTFHDVFHTSPNTRPNVGTITPEQVRAKEEQEAHMQSFKELWDIDQPAKTETPVVANPTPVRASSSSVFGSIGGQSVLNSTAPTANGGFSEPVAPTPPPESITSLRAHSSPPRATFKPTSSPF